MENNLYYTPTIEEFHVGFECEILGIIGAKEDERLFSQPTIISQKELLLIDYLEIRVKYLDQSDIESLGWVFKETNNNGNLYQKGIYFLYQKDNKINIEDRIGKSLIESTHYFYGTIKNKSELIKLQQQLNIK